MSHPLSLLFKHGVFYFFPLELFFYFYFLVEIFNYVIHHPKKKKYHSSYFSPLHRTIIIIIIGNKTLFKFAHDNITHLISFNLCIY